MKFERMKSLCADCLAAVLICGCNVSLPSVGSPGGNNDGNPIDDSPGKGQPPWVDVGPHERNVQVGGKVTLDATASSDPDGDLITCRWQQSSGPWALDIVRAPGNDCHAEVMATTEGVYSFTVSVSDGDGNSANATVEVRVGESPRNGCPFADAGIDQAIREGRSVTLRGVNSADPQGDALDYEWYQLEGPDVSLSNMFTTDPVFTAPLVDRETRLEFQLVASDGECASADTVVVFVQDAPDLIECASNEDCEDSLFCNGLETCEDGRCTAGFSPCHSAEVCDEEADECLLPDCTMDADCDDGLFCNGSEQCTEGLCQAGEPPCDPLAACDEAADVCLEPDCTIDADCDDGMFCNGSEICMDGECLSGAGPCDSPAACDEATDTCAESECVTDADCDDGLYCNGPEECVSGECLAAVSDPCDESEACDEATDTCIPVSVGCESDDDCAAGELCDVESGECIPMECPPTAPLQMCASLEYASELLATASNPQSRAQRVAIADFNGDCEPDLLFSYYGTYSSGASGSAQVLAHGGGGYDVLSEGNGEVQAAVGDLNGDGWDDIVSVNSLTNDLSVFINVAGRFTEPTIVPVGSRPAEAELGDLNGDGHLDIAVVNYNSATVTVLLNAGDATFPRPRALAVGAYVSSLALTDLNGDGALDLVTGHGGFSSFAISILQGVGDGSFLPAVEVATGHTPRHVAAGDFDGDGLADLAAAHFNADTVAVLYGDGTGGFSGSVVYDVGDGPTDVLATDLDGDGRDDLIVPGATSHDLTLLRSNGDGNFRVSEVTVSDGAVGVTAADGDNDGDVDLMVASGGRSVSYLKNLCIE